MGVKSTIENLINDPTDYSEAEGFIAEFFKSEGIKFKYETKLSDLKGDTKSYRIPDFYLPRYKTYVEFFGQWGVNEHHTKRYIEKKDIYARNNVPCVYIYPENLGFIEYAFNYRLKKELKKYSLKKELFLFRLSLFMKDRFSVFIWSFIAILILAFSDYKTDPSTNLTYIGFCSIIILYQIYRMYEGYVKFFKD